jgi:hypothetical protein
MECEHRLSDVRTRAIDLCNYLSNLIFNENVYPHIYSLSTALFSPREA